MFFEWLSATCDETYFTSFENRKKIYFITNNILIFLENQTLVNWITCNVNSIRSEEQCAEQIIYLLCALPALLFQLWFHLFRKKSSNPTKSLSFDNVLFSEKVISWLWYEIGLLWTVSYYIHIYIEKQHIHWILFQTAIIFGMHVEKRAVVYHRICGFVFILCLFACLPPTQAPVPVKYMQWNIIQALNSTLNTHR